MRADDRSFILNLTYRAADAGSPTWRNEDKMIAFHQRFAEETAEASGQDQAVLVAESRAGRQLGVVHVIRTTDYFTGEEQGYLTTIAVANGVDSRGVARALMVAAEDWTRHQGLSVLALDVLAANSRARTFYGWLGFADETVKMTKKV